jgi:hypothetical protein
MPHELPVDWVEIEKACIAGVPQRQVAKDVAAKTEGVEAESLYKAIRKRASRERWPIPASIMRRARAQAMVATGAATDAKQGATWRPGESGRKQAGLMLGALGIEHQERVAADLLGVADGPESGNLSLNGAEGVVNAVAGAVNGSGEALQSAPPSATELVTADLAQLGSRGLRAILSRATEAAEAMHAAPEIRSWTDVQVMTKVISQAAGLDKPAVAVAVSLNNGANASILAWESIESENTYQN